MYKEKVRNSVIQNLSDWLIQTSWYRTVRSCLKVIAISRTRDYGQIEITQSYPKQSSRFQKSTKQQLALLEADVEDESTYKVSRQQGKCSAEKCVALCIRSN